jgi:DNA polymerase III epsilon subunit-like protein
MCVFEYGRSDGRIYRVIGAWDWLEDPGIPIPPEITRLTGITDQMVAGHRIDDDAVTGLLAEVVLVIAHNGVSAFLIAARALSLACQWVKRPSARSCAARSFFNVKIAARRSHSSSVPT